LQTTAYSTVVILVVEDDGALRETLLEVLSDFGYRGVGVSTSEAPSRAFAGEEPKLVIVDVQHEHAASRAFIELVLARRPAPPVLIVSVAGPAVEMARELGLQRISKPFEMTHLIEQIDRALGREARAIQPTRRLRPFTGLP
jgi:DNA-binding NtrC family response regulator